MRYDWSKDELEPDSVSEQRGIDIRRGGKSESPEDVLDRFIRDYGYLPGDKLSHRAIDALEALSALVRQRDEAYEKAAWIADVGKYNALQAENAALRRQRDAARAVMNTQLEGLQRQERIVDAARALVPDSINAGKESWKPAYVALREALDELDKEE